MYVNLYILTQYNKWKNTLHFFHIEKQYGIQTKQRLIELIQK